MKNPRTIASCLRAAAEAFPDKRAFGYLEDGSTIGPECTYAALLARVTALAEYLQASGLGGHPVLLLYAEGLDFVTAFLACQEAQVVAVPMFLPRSNRHMARLGHILADVGARVILTTTDLVAKVRTGLCDYAGYAQLHLLPTDAPLPAAAPPLLTPVPHRGLAFVQYTSGSTGSPRGVVISQDNLLHNQSLLAETFGGTAASVIFSWLPFYHDMGLIGNILHAVYLGATCLLMSPLHFIQQPLRWLRAIDRYRVTHSGGPNFCYDLCADAAPEAELAGLDLRSWQVAYNGAEPVKRATMERFAACFAGAGLKRAAFYPCYGLAEATLLVAGVKAAGADFRSVLVDRAALNQGLVRLLPKTAAAEGAGTFLVSSGRVPTGMDVRILASPVAQGIAIGEIVLAGASVSRGYWPLPESEKTAAAADAYLPTGDLGFLHDGHLFVTGRKKELLIIRGKNYYPYDIETTCATAHPALQRNATVAVAVSVGEQEQLVLLAEVRRADVRGLDVTAVKTALHNRVVEAVGLAPFDIVLLGPLRIPRTSSGKLQRIKCGQLYQEGALDQERLDTPAPAASEMGNRAALLGQLKASKQPDLLRQYLRELFRARLQQPGLELHPDDELAALGIDSVRAMELVNTLNQELGISLEPTWVFTANTVGGLLATIEVALWVAQPQAAGRGILL